MRAGGWQHTIGPELAGHTLGIVGLGRLGARMAGIARAFEHGAGRLEPEPHRGARRRGGRRAGEQGGAVLDRRTS